MPSRSMPPSHVHRILVADDDLRAADGLRLLLELDGYDVVALKSSDEALRRIEAEVFDAVITDLGMPRYDGLRIVEAARNAKANMPILVMTGHWGSPVCDDALRAGARRVFGKPIDYDQLVGELRASLSS